VIEWYNLVYKVGRLILREKGNIIFLLRMISLVPIQWDFQKQSHPANFISHNCHEGCIFSHVRPFYEQAVSDQPDIYGDQHRSMHRSLWVLAAHSSFIEHTTKNMFHPISFICLQIAIMLEIAHACCWV